MPLGHGNQSRVIRTGSKTGRSVEPRARKSSQNRTVCQTELAETIKVMPDLLSYLGCAEPREDGYG